MCLKDKCITSVIKHAFTPNTYLKNSKCLQKCNKRMTYHNTHWNGNASNRNPHYKKHTSNYILTPLNSKVMPTKFQLCKINTSGFLKVFPRLNNYELIVDDKQYIKLLTKIMLQLCLASGTTLKLKTRDEHKTLLNMIVYYTLEVEIIMDPYNQGFDLPIESQYNLKDVIMSEVACPIHIAPKPLHIPISHIHGPL